MFWLGETPSVAYCGVAVDLGCSFVLSRFLYFLGPVERSNRVGRVDFVYGPIGRYHRGRLILCSFVPSIGDRVDDGSYDLFSNSWQRIIGGRFSSFLIAASVSRLVASSRVMFFGPWL